MRDGAPRIGRPRRDNTMVYHEAVESELGFVCHLNNLLSNASRGARRLGALPKSCHLLPFAAILSPQDRYVRFNRSIPFLTPRGYAGQPGPRAENRERGQEGTLGAKSHRVSFRLMIDQQRESPKTQLSVALAQGTSAAKWARTNGVPKATAYRWSQEPAVRAQIESIRHRAIDRAVGRLAKRATWALDGIVELGGNADSESVRWSALRAVTSDFIAVSAGSVVMLAGNPQAIPACEARCLSHSKSHHRNSPMKFAGDRRTGKSVQTEPLYPRRLDVCRSVVCPAARDICRITKVHPRRNRAPRGCAPTRRVRTQSPSVPDLRARARHPKSGAYEPKVHLCRICGLARRARIRRERSQNPCAPDLRARASGSDSARTNPKSICAGFAGTRLPNQIGENEPKVHLCRICRRAAQRRNCRERSHFRGGRRQQSSATLKRAKRSQFQVATDVRARGPHPKSARTKPFQRRQKQLASGYAEFRWHTRHRRVLLSRGFEGIMLIPETMTSRMFRIQNACQAFQKWAGRGSYS